MLFEIKDVDRQFYDQKLRDFLPDKMIDVHTHVWLAQFNEDTSKGRGPAWPGRVASSNSIEDLHQTYQLMFPDKKVTPAAFTNPDCNLQNGNDYIASCGAEGKLYPLLFSHPQWPAESFEKQLLEHNFYGAKVYLNFAPDYIPSSEIRIFDFLPHHHLNVLNKVNKIVMLHIPRNKRLKDPVNLAQMLEIEDKYPDVKLIIAHVGRAYCDNDAGNAFEILRKTEKMMFDFSANTNSRVFEQLIEAVGPERILFGSDLPITRMRMRRITENGRYINLVPKGMYGDVSGDPNMREVEADQAQMLSFFLYEQIEAFRIAARKTGLSDSDIEKVFYSNSKKLLGL